MPSITIAPHDPLYPTPLASLATPRTPAPTLYVRGVLPSAPGIAVVGTRAPSREACDFTRWLVRGLAAEGFAIWSGGALGIDAAAHEAALEAGAPTVVVAGGGLDRPYPKEHVPLFARVLASGGALVARVADDVPPSPPRFLQRNEVLAALTVVTVVIEAGLASGARSTAAAARRLGRPLCVVPHAPWDERGAGCALELARGAHAVIASGDVIAAALGTEAVVARRRRRSAAGSGQTPLPLGRAVAVSESSPAQEPPDLTDVDRVVLSALGATAMHIDEVCERTGVRSPVVLAALLTLTLSSVVVEGPAGFYRRGTRP